MPDIITTLHPENDENTNLYPNIKKENIPNNCIDENMLEDDSVTTNKIKDNSIIGAKIRDNTINGDKLEDGSIDSNKLSSDSFDDTIIEWLDEHPEATTTVEDGSITLAKLNDNLKKIVVNDYVTPEQYGAVGDGVTDDTLALQSAINTGKMVLLTNKTYLISDSLINPVCIIGVSQRTSIILMDGNQPIIKFTADVPGGMLKSLCLSRKLTINITSLTSAIGIKINDNVTLGHYIFDNIYLRHNYRGFEAINYSNIYSCTISNIWINDFTNNGIHFNCRGATGCVFSNIYITNWSDYTTLTLGTCAVGIHLQNFTESILQQINVEHAIIKNCLVFNGCNNMKVESLHIEGIVPYEDYAGFIVNVLSSRVIIDTVMMGFSGNNAQGYESASSVTLSNAYLFGVKSDNVLLYIKSVYLRNNAFTYVPNNKRVCYFNSNLNDVYFIVEFYTDRNIIFGGFQGNRTNIRIPYCKQLDNLKYYELINNRNVLLYVDNNPNNINYKGFFEMGDRFQAKTPISDVSEWICTSRGTFEEPDMVALGKFTQYQSALYLTSNADTDLVMNTSIKIGENYYVTNSNIYESSTYPGYPYAINLKSPINNPTAEDVALKIGKPILKTINVE